MVTRATQFTNCKLHPVIKKTGCAFLFVCVCENVSMVVLYLCIFTILTTQGHGSSSECTPEVLPEPPLYTGNDGRLRPVCSSRRLMTRTTEPQRAGQTPVPLWSGRCTDMKNNKVKVRIEHERNYKAAQTKQYPQLVLYLNYYCLKPNKRVFIFVL